MSSAVDELASTSRERGPATENCAHCSVTETICTSSSGHSTWWQNSRCCSTLAGVGRRGRDDEMLLGRAGSRCRRRARSRPRAASGRSARCPTGSVEQRVDVDAVEERGRVGALHVDLAERRDIADADRLRAPSHASRVDALLPVVSPACGYYCARSHSPVSTNTAPCACAQRVRRRQARRPEVLAAVRAGERADATRAYRAGGTWSCRSRGSCGRSAPP